jgi:hypothetical protein
MVGKNAGVFLRNLFFFFLSPCGGWKASSERATPPPESSFLVAVRSDFAFLPNRLLSFCEADFRHWRFFHRWPRLTTGVFKDIGVLQGGGENASDFMGLREICGTVYA